MSDHELDEWKRAWAATPSPDVTRWLANARRRARRHAVLGWLSSALGLVGYLGLAFSSLDVEWKVLGVAGATFVLGASVYWAALSRQRVAESQRTTVAWLEHFAARARARLRYAVVFKRLSLVWLVLVGVPFVGFMLVERVHDSLAFLSGVATGLLPALALAWWKLRREEAEARRELSEATALLEH